MGQLCFFFVGIAVRLKRMKESKGHRKEVFKLISIGTGGDLKGEKVKNAPYVILAVWCLQGN